MLTTYYLFSTILGLGDMIVNKPSKCLHLGIPEPLNRVESEAQSYYFRLFSYTSQLIFLFHVN